MGGGYLSAPRMLSITPARLVSMSEFQNETAGGCLSSGMKTESFQFRELHPQFDFLRREPFAKCASDFVAKAASPPVSTPSHAIVVAVRGTDWRQAEAIFSIPPAWE